MDAVMTVPEPRNEPVRSYAPGTPERAALEARIKELAGDGAELTMTIGDERRMGGGAPIDVVEPHNHAHVLGQRATRPTTTSPSAIEAARAAAPAWRAMPFDDRAAIFLRAADLLAGPWRATLNAATILGQSKSVQQAEIDAACELIDFLRFNVRFAQQILADQPLSPPGVWNRLEYRPLEGFVLAITPFNFTAIAGNLPTAPALMGNVVVWKPSPDPAARRALHDAAARGRRAAARRDQPGHRRRRRPSPRSRCRTPTSPGIHFTGSTATFQHLWRTVGENIAGYRAYPRLVGETGGKDFVVAHPSADPAVLETALIRGAFEYQGQKCSAASRAYVPRSVWNGDARRPRGRGRVADHGRRRRGPVAVHGRGHRRARVRQAPRGDRAGPGADVDRRSSPAATCDDSRGLLRPADRPGVRPTRTTRSSPRSTSARSSACTSTTTRDYDDGRSPRLESVAPYALTGAIFAQDRAAIAAATEALRFAAGNFYVNDKPTGAVVGQQPFGGARASGTNDKAGLDAQPDPLDEHPLDQGDLRPADRLPLPAHGHLTAGSGRASPRAGARARRRRRASVTRPDGCGECPEAGR